MGISYRIDAMTGSMQRNLTLQQRAFQNVFAQLGTGRRIQRAGDDAAGLQISEGLETQIRGEKKVQENIQNMLALLNASEGLVTSVRERFSRIRDLIITAMNDTQGTEQRAAIKSEINENIRAAIQMGRNFRFNGKAYFEDSLNVGAYSADPIFTAQIGTTASQSNQMQFRVSIQDGLYFFLDNQSNDLFNLQVIDDLGKDYVGRGLLGFGVMVGLGNDMDSTEADDAYAASLSNPVQGMLEYLFSLDTPSQRQYALNGVDRMLNFFNNEILVNIGSYTNRLEMAAANSEVKMENQLAAQARITNTDYAAASVELNRTQVLQSATVSLMNQAKINHQTVLSLIQPNR